MNITEMPHEILLIIFEKLSGRDLRSTAMVCLQFRSIVTVIRRRPYLDLLPRNILVRVFKFLDIDDLVQLTKCKNSFLRCVAFDRSLWQKVVILEPLVEPYGEELQEWIKCKTGEIPFLAFFDYFDLPRQIERFKTWKRFPCSHSV